MTTEKISFIDGISSLLDYHHNHFGTRIYRLDNYDFTLPDIFSGIRLSELAEEIVVVSDRLYRCKSYFNKSGSRGSYHKLDKFQRDFSLIYNELFSLTHHFVSEESQTFYSPVGITIELPRLEQRRYYNFPENYKDLVGYRLDKQVSVADMTANHYTEIPTPASTGELSFFGLPPDVSISLGVSWGSVNPTIREPINRYSYFDMLSELEYTDLLISIVPR